MIRVLDTAGSTLVEWGRQQQQQQRRRQPQWMDSKEETTNLCHMQINDHIPYSYYSQFYGTAWFYYGVFVYFTL